MNIRIYVAGPMTLGDYMRNVRAGIDAGNALRDFGFIPFIPHLMSYWHVVHERPYEDWMAMDLAWIDVCDGLLRIPGQSSGADREVVHAEKSGKPVFHRIGDVVAYYASRMTGSGA